MTKATQIHPALASPRQTHPTPAHPTTEALEAETQKMIAADPDAPEATEEALAEASPFTEMFPHLIPGLQKARGRPPVETPRRQVSIRLDPDVIDKFRATGKGWQSKINEILKAAKI